MGYTIVTAFLDIKRENWTTIHARSIQKYLENAKRMLSLKNNMVIYIEDHLYDFVHNCRKDQLDITKIIVVSLNDLPAMKYYDSFCSIMNSHDYKIDLKDDTVPECSEPLYDVIMFSKTYFLKKSIESDFFNSSHYIWLDFGVHPHMLTDDFLNKKLFEDDSIRSEISFMCLSIPSVSDLNIKKYYKSHTVRLAGTMFTGNKENFLLLHDYMQIEIQECIKNNVIDSDQALFNVIYLKHPEKFKLWFGDWKNLINNYCSSKNNRDYIFSLMNDCLIQNNTHLYSEITSSLS